MISYRFDYNEDIIDVLKAFGGKWDKVGRRWLVVEDKEHNTLLSGVLRKEFPSVKIEISGNITVPALVQPRWMNRQLRDYQAEGVLRAINAKEGYLFGYEMGLGKTATTLETIRQLEVTRNVLIVTSAINRHTWLQQIEQWWPKDEYKVCIYTPELKAKLKKGKVAIDSSYEIFITSYGLISDFLANSEEVGFEGLPSRFDAIVCDEAHYLSNPKSIRSREVLRLHELNPNSGLFALSGTPARDRLYDIFPLLKIIQPNHWGNWHSLVKRYCKLRADKYSQWNIDGMLEERIGELQMRINSVCHRVTKQEVIDQLPKFSFIPVFVEQPKKQHKRIEDVADLDKWMLESGYNKVDYVVDWVKEYVEAKNNKRLCVCLYHYEIADKVYGKLNELGIGPLFYANGRMNPEQRIAEIKRSIDAENAVLIVTMESIKTGINDLKAYSRALFGEWHWSPEVITQAMARFHRMDSPEPVEVYGIVMKGTKDEEIVSALRSKISEIDKIISSGTLEEKLNMSLIQDKRSDVEIAAAWASVTAIEKGDYDL